MAVSRLYPFFLISACFQAAAVYVKPPVNVTLTCRNLLNVVEWDYGEFPPGLIFEVTILSTTSPRQNISVVPPALTAVLPFLTDPKSDFYLTVKAVIGHIKSESAPPDGIEFSYFMDSPAKQKCALDFPPLNVTDQKDGHVLFSFTHPQLLLDKNQREMASDDEFLAELEYYAAVNNQEAKRFTCYESVCEGLLSATAQEKLCVKVNGVMDKMAVKAAQEYCARPVSQDKTDYTPAFIVSGLLAAVVAFLVLFLVYKQKTKPSTSTPNSTTFLNKVKQMTMGVTPEQILPVEVMPPSPTPLLTPEEDKQVTPTDLSATEPVLRLPTGVSAEDEGVCDDEEIENCEGPGYMPGKILEEEESEYSAGGSGYEKREVIVDIAPDEQAEGYRF